MIIIVCICGSLVMTYFIGRIIMSIQFTKEVKELFSLSKPIPDKIFYYSQLEGLPEPVQRYFKHVMKEGQQYISYARLTHNGQFKTGQNKDWVTIEGEQYFTTKKPGFIWKGKTSMFTAIDSYIDTKGKLNVTLFSLFNIVNASGEKYNQGELLRWLAEGVWFPTNLLPSEKLKWEPIDKNTSKLSFNYKGLSLFYNVTFNDIGEITQMKTKRYMNGDKYETWIGELKDYREINGILVPTNIEAIWRLEQGDFSYAKFHVKKLEYDKPEKF